MADDSGDSRSRDRIQSIERGVEVLRAFDGRNSALSIADIANTVGLSRPVVRRILLTFAHLGYAESANGLWNLTPRILELSVGYFGAASLPEVSYPFMSDVVERTGETCSVGTLDRGEVLHVARLEDRRPLPHSVRVGTRLPAHATATGKVLLAHLSTEALEEFLSSSPFDVHTPNTIATAAAMRERLASIREQGYDISQEELNPGMIAAAVAIIHDGVAIGGISVSSTTVRENEEAMRETIIPVLREAADRIAAQYRYANPHLSGGRRF
ncbi:IclR family transcriptional regulator domain-containing protein [Citricoccus alkalitolerans]|uniref:IclR family transcriptional regulator C-terminal domain-containing protein n=1 Tax=Citricoccus alkalitolerans TaxID=246603 RepID=A0ABV8XY62_9MICC